MGRERWSPRVHCNRARVRNGLVLVCETPKVNVHGFARGRLFAESKRVDEVAPTSARVHRVIKDFGNQQQV